MTDDQKTRLLSELIELSGYRIRRPGDIDVDDYAREAGCSPQAARRRLHKLVEEGILECALACDSGKPPYLVWWRVDNGKPSGEPGAAGV